MNRSVQWLNANRHRSYPIVEDSKVSFTGAEPFTLPTDFLLDFEFTSYELRDGTLKLMSIEISGGGTAANMLVQYTSRDGAATYDLVVTIPVNPSTPYRYLVTTGDYTLTAVFGEGVNTVLGRSDGTYTAEEPIPLEPALFIFQGRHRVNSIIGDTDESVPVSGDVYFEEGYNMLIKINRLSNSISFVPVQGAGAGVTCEELEPERDNCNDVLLRVNGAYPTPEGVIQLIGGRGISIQSRPGDNEVVVRTRVMPGEIECEINSE